ncbi:MAG: hypothetical protein ACKOYP_00015, partial [Bacteroidota bacterium]
NKVTINASLFAHNTDYYMFGGYGLWSNRSTLLRLNRYDRWEPVIFEREDGRSEAESFPPPLHHTVFIISGDTGIIYNGYLVDPTDRLHKPTWDGVWMLDIPGRRWQELGTLNREFIPSPDFPILSITVPTGTLLFPDTQSVPLLQKNGRMMTIHRHSLASLELLSNDHTRWVPFYRNGSIHYYHAIDRERGLPETEQLVEFRSIDLEDFLGPVTGEAPLFFPTNSGPSFPWWGYLLLALLPGGIIALKKFRNQAKPLAELTAEGIRYRSTLHELDPSAHAILQVLLNHDGAVSSDALVAAIRNPNLQYSHNNRIKNELMRQLNVQLRAILNVKEDLITSTFAGKDKRFRWYTLDRSRFRS